MTNFRACLPYFVCLVTLLTGSGCPESDDGDEGSPDAAAVADVGRDADTSRDADKSRDADTSPDAAATDAAVDTLDAPDVRDASPDSAPADPCANPTSPGSITGVDLSTAVFVGRPALPAAERPSTPTAVDSFAAYRAAFSYADDTTGRADGERHPGGSPAFTPTADNLLAWSVHLFFENGGDAAVIVPTVDDVPNAAELDELETLPSGGLLVVPSLSSAEPDSARQLGFSRVASVLNSPGNDDLFFIGDLPAGLSATDIEGATSPSPLDFRHERAALYHPWLRVSSAVDGAQLVNVPPAGAVAGIVARTDHEDGIWQAPAGLEANVQGIAGLAQSFDARDIDRLNPNEVNALRFYNGTAIIWGARTRQASAEEWKYVPVRRLGTYVERSIYEGTDWAVFQANDAALWSTLESETEAFLRELWMQGGLQGTTASEAYFVRADATTTSAADIADGLAVIQVGIATLRPAEFTILTIERPAGTCSD